ncbi:MAG: hypothetical protein V3R77_06225, partial [Candidatus Binatia bacterium]
MSMLGFRSTFAVAGLAVVVTCTPALAGPSFHCTAAVVVDELRLFGTPGLAALDVDVEYPVPEVEVLGSGADVECELGPAVAAIGAQPTFSDDDEGSLSVRFEAESGVPAVQFAVAICRLAAAEAPEAGDFSVSVNDAKFPDGSSTGFTPRVLVGDVTCSEDETPTTTTTTSTTSSTSSTLPADPVCADVDASGAATASDCLAILRRAVGLSECVRACVCDPDGN